MFNDKELIIEFLSQVNAHFTGKNEFGPIKTYLQSQEEFMSYFLVRYLGGDKNTALFSELVYQFANIFSDIPKWQEYSQKYWKNTIDIKLRGVFNLNKILDKDILQNITPRQILSFSLLIQDISQKMDQKLQPEIQRVWQGIFEITSMDRNFYGNLSLSQFLDIQANSVHYYKLGLPCYLALSIENDNLREIQEMAKQITVLYILSHDQIVAEFLVYNSLSDSERFVWWGLTNGQKMDRILDSGVMKQIEEFKQKTLERINFSLSKLSLNKSQQGIIDGLIMFCKGGS